jgi:hypothetical protein
MMQMDNEHKGIKPELLDLALSMGEYKTLNLKDIKFIFSFKPLQDNVFCQNTFWDSQMLDTTEIQHQFSIVYL